MNVSYATCKSTITNATRQSQEQAIKLVSQILSTSLQGLNLPGGKE